MQSPNHLGTRPARRIAAPLLFALSLSLAPSFAHAHPGHGGGFLPGLLHPFHGLDHLLAAIAVGLWAVRLGGRAIWAFPLSFVAGLVAGGLLGKTGFALPATEAMIGLSVLVLGIVVAANARFALAAGVAVVAAFGAFHGGAHGMEAPLQESFGAYAVGLVFATAALHASGIGLGLWLKARVWIVRLAAAPIALAGAAMLVGRLA